MQKPTKRIDDLILRFLKREISSSDVQELQRWLEQDPANIVYFNEANEKFQATATVSKFDRRRVQDAWQRLTTRIKEEEKISGNVPAELLRGRAVPYLRAAASVSITLVALFTIWKLAFHHKVTGQKDNLVEYRSGDKNVHIVLPDSTGVWLNTNSSIEYSSRFSEKREVLLKGEAFFDVRKKHKQTFVVRTEHMSIQVKGTRFNVSAYEAKDENATLEEGSIELTIKGENQTYAMKPGEQFTINKVEQTIILKKVNPSNFSAWKEDKLVFDNALLEDIVAKLENRYQVKIVIDSAIAQRERLTMTVEQEPIEDILEVIQLSSMLHYKIEDNRILIYE